MEEQHDRSIQTKTLSTRKYISFPLIYWFVFFILIICFSYSDGQKRLANYEFTEGIVIDKLFLPYGRRSRQDVEFSQWRYIAGTDTLLFVDKQPFTRYKPIGTKRTVIYLKDDVALVYSFQFWINLPYILVFILIAVFVFAICLFIIHWNDRTWFTRKRKYL